MKIMNNKIIDDLKEANKKILDDIANIEQVDTPVFFTKEKTGIDINIKYLDNEVPRLRKIDKGDWIDLYAAEDVTLNIGDFKLINLGIAMQIPEGYEAIVVPRSSTFKNWGIIMTNSIGVIDESYCGDNDYWRFPAFCIRGNNSDSTIIHKGDKIAQFRIIEHMPNPFFCEVEKLDGKDRGGFGTTGTK